MSSTTVLAYLDAGTGAALAAVVASGAVGARAVLASAKGKFRRKGAATVDAEQHGEAEASRAVEGEPAAHDAG